MITPLDIETKEFKKGLRGYNEQEVNGFLDEIQKDYENLYRENIEIKDNSSWTAGVDQKRINHILEYPKSETTELQWITSNACTTKTEWRVKKLDTASNASTLPYNHDDIPKSW